METSHGTLLPLSQRRRDARQTEVPHFRGVFSIQNNVGRFDIPMKRLRAGVVHVRKPLGGVEGDGNALRTIKNLDALARPTDALVHVPAGEELIHKNALAVLTREAVGNVGLS